MLFPSSWFFRLPSHKRLSGPGPNGVKASLSWGEPAASGECVGEFRSTRCDNDCLGVVEENHVAKAI
ncbi:hypothetical protein PBY51_015578 [Eleginops maclovinus]|uniref:Uncharacterized protein n=1 Tax=Eleginops maclovinus TaxID=56733 RepID=A0AAN8AR90_ELEMC|nr:hypothetical protein PBY51_015578 [Eleginops maclovinus]